MSCEARSAPSPCGRCWRWQPGCAGSDPIGGGGTAERRQRRNDGGGGPGTGGRPAARREAPTFTWLYDNIFHGYCSDRNQPCHNPGMNRGVELLDAGPRLRFGRCSTSVPGDSFASDLYYFISAGVMPPINPQVPADLPARCWRPGSTRARSTTDRSPSPSPRFAGRGEQTRTR